MTRTTQRAGRPSFPRRRESIRVETAATSFPRGRVRTERASDRVPASTRTAASTPAIARLVLAAAAILIPLVAAIPVAAQGVPGSPLTLAHGAERDGAARYRDPPVNVEGRYVVISLDEHRLHLMEGERVIWSAVVGTGTGTRLEGAGQRWDFSTPRGMFRVQLKEKDPVWRVPDWAFVERGVPIPPAGAPERSEIGMLGTTALYLEEDIAVHGTNKPELLGQAVSHGCIRMTNEAARRLYHEVEVGTPVIIY